MPRATCIAAALLLSFAVLAGAQTAGVKKVGLAVGMQRSYATMKMNLTQSAAKMPEADFGFKPGSASELRSFGQWVGHQTDNQYLNCSILKGVANPSADGVNEKKTGKAALVKALADAFAYCDEAMAALTDQSALQLVKRGEEDMARGAVVSLFIGHGVESNGIMTVYLQAKGIP